MKKIDKIEEILIGDDTPFFRWVSKPRLADTRNQRIDMLKDKINEIIDALEELRSDNQVDLDQVNKDAQVLPENVANENTE